MKRTNLKSILRLRSRLMVSKVEPSTLKLFLMVSLMGFASISLAIAEELTEQIPIIPVVQEESKGSIRIVITTSGPAQFTSYWLDNPPSLVVEFQTKNVVSTIGSELIVNEGAIKRITSEYYSDGQNKTLKSFTFELLEKVSYKIWQEENNILEFGKFSNLSSEKSLGSQKQVFDTTKLLSRRELPENTAQKPEKVPNSRILF